MLEEAKAMLMKLIPSMKSDESIAAEDEKKEKVVEEVAAMLQIANKERERYDKQLDTNRKAYLGAHREIYGYSATGFYAVINLIKGSIDNKASILNEQTVRPSIKARSDGEPPDWYILPGQTLQSAEGLTEGQIQGVESVPAEVAMTLEQSGVQVIAINDDFACEAITHELQSQWIADLMDEKLACCNRDKMIYGWRDQVIEWNPVLNKGQVKSLFPYSVWIDPMSSGSSTADFAIVVNWVSKGEATKRFPKLREKIDNFSANTLFGKINMSVGSRFTDLVKSNKIPLLTCWVRNSRFPLSIEEATESGQVQFVAPVEGEEPQENPAMVLADGTPVMFDQEGWPYKFVLRQIEMCGTEVTMDGPSDFRDLPVSRNMNYPIPDSPHGLGDPEVVGDVQDLINREFGIFHDYSRNYRMPMMVAPQSLFEKMPGFLKNGYKNPNMVIPLDDTLFMEMGGKPLQQMEVPSMPDTVFNILNKLLDQFDRLSGHNEAMRGDAKAGFSGTLYKQMTANARGPIAEQARESAEHIERLVRVWVGLIIDFLPPEEFAERNKKYPASVMYCVKQRMAKADFTVDVQVSGADTSKQDGQDMANFAQTAPDMWKSKTFVKTVMEKMRIPNSAAISEEISQTQQPPVENIPPAA